MPTPILMPELGVPLARLSLWFVETGARVEQGDRLLEILTGPATFDLSAPASGILRERTVCVNDRLLPGQTLGFIEEV